MNSSRIVCFGELLLRLSSPGRELLLQSPTLQVHIGGAEANVAVSLRRLGHQTSIVSAVPTNALGDAVIGEFRRYGVDTTHIQQRDGRMGVYFLTHGSGHRPAEVLYDRADSVFAKASADIFDWSSILRGAQWLHVSGITPAVSAQAADSALRAMRAARSANIKVSFDCNFRSKLWGERAPQAPTILRELASHADLLFGEHRDIALMFASSFDGAGEQRARAAADFAFKQYPQLQWIAATVRNRDTMDSQELAGQLHTRSESHTSRFFTLSGIVDRIGSGDAFAAGVIDQLLQNASLETVAAFGCAAAVLKHSIPGDFNLSSRSDIEAVINEHTTDVRR